MWNKKIILNTKIKNPRNRKNIYKKKPMMLTFNSSESKTYIKLSTN